MAALVFPALVMLKGHPVEEVPDPSFLVTENKVGSYEKNEEAALLLEEVKA